ncbi:HAD family phosphatase [Aliihoeflea sp. 40Bstr573]|uniref:HAD family hydrolase n=1 Tax=Aliihoeflea sp. 40Bstr573 TaxID=2696467 RepID=UPI0020966123|nr:HAD family phosphatase [Aliihoeflea sp. 40Bstr573]MCO6386080.1 HAD-IA family hydrolase [Aliihoeflea sp. 40Bstr573]
MREIRHIVFDIGRVLIHYDPDLAYRDLIPDAEHRRWFLETVTTGDWNLEQDRGRRWDEAEALLVADFPDHETNIRAFRQNWHKMVPHAYDDSVAVLEALIEDGHDVTMLTNFATDTFAEAKERFAFLKMPRGVTVSGDHKLIKPDFAIYDLHARTFGLNPKHTLFIDDSAKNVEGAKLAGWQAVQFTDVATLKRHLEDYGIAI